MKCEFPVGQLPSHTNKLVCIKMNPPLFGVVDLNQTQLEWTPELSYLPLSRLADLSHPTTIIPGLSALCCDGEVWRSAGFQLSMVRWLCPGSLLIVRHIYFLGVYSWKMCLVLSYTCRRSRHWEALLLWQRLVSYLPTLSRGIDRLDFVNGLICYLSHTK
jgi:hypothetical protein